MTSRIQPPPRLLTGATLLFWGAMTGRPLIGLLMAILVESPHWLRWRWDFGPPEFARAWQLSLMLSAGYLVLLLIDGEREMLMPLLITWLPALLLPLQLAQTFGMRAMMPMSALSFFAGRRRERNLRLGIDEPEVQFHFGNAYFIVCLVAAALGTLAEGRLFLPGLLALCVWRLLALPGRRTLAIAVVCCMAGVMALAGQVALNRAYDWFSRGHGGSSWLSDATHGYTSIGGMRDLKLSREIRWRLRPLDGSLPPRLLRRATFNRYRGSTWEITRRPGMSGGADGQFSDLDTFERVVGEAFYLANPEIDTEVATDDGLPRFSLRGSVRPGGAFPLPGDVASFRDFDLDAAQRNLLSTVRVFPAAPVIDGIVLWQAETATDGEPVAQEDLLVPLLEAEVIQRMAEQIGIDDSMETGEIMGRIQHWFAREFGYTLYLSMRDSMHSFSDKTAIARFLEDTRSGHCEYFATASVFLLRAVGVPARYTTGYAIAEVDARRNEFIIRGTHAHAWCRVWVEEEGKWVDFDPTPSDWFALEALGEVTRMQRIQDALKRMREDLFIWRSDPENRQLLLMIITIPTLIGGVWIGRRLWKSRHRQAGGALRAAGAGGRPSPLHGLEPLVRRRIGARPHGMPYAQWLLPLAHELNGAGEVLREALVLHQRMRFDPGFDDEAAQERLAEMTRDLRRALKEMPRGEGAGG